MTQLSDQTKQQIYDHALSEYPKESCGIIVAGKYIRLENQSEEPTKSFKIENTIFIDYEVEAIVHSHPDWFPCPSKADMLYQSSTNVPWYIVSVGKEGVNGITCFGDTEIKPYVGRGFCHGITDCYSLIRDFYKKEFSINLSDYPRDWEWWHQKDCDDFYINNFKKEGFRKISPEEVKRGDLFFASVRCKTINHAGLYYGNGLILHHLGSRYPYDLSRLSGLDVAERWSGFIQYWLRHENSNSSWYTS